MKRVISLLIALLIFAGSFSIECLFASVLPKDDSQYDIEGFKNDAYDRFRRFMDDSGGWNVLTDDKLYDYILYVETLKDNFIFQAFLESEEFITNKNWGDFFQGDFSNDDIKVRYYIIALSSLLMTMEDNMSDIRVSQAKATISKTLTDYAIDATSITASVLSKDASGQGFEVLEKSFDLCGTGISVLGGALNSVQRLEALQMNAEKYVSYRNMLSTFNNTDDKYLKEATKTLIQSLDKIYNYRLAGFEDWADIAIETQGNQFFSVLDDVIEDAEKSGDSFEGIGGLKLIDTTADRIGYFKLGVDIGKYVGDVFIKSSDHIQRYYEMCAMVSCREALIKSIEGNNSRIKDGNDIDLINDTVILCKDLNYINLRGAYCAYSILTKDVGLFSKAFCVSNGAELNEWLDTVGSIFNSLDIHLSFVVPELEGYLKPEEINEEESIFANYLSSGGYETLLLEHSISSVFNYNYDVKTFLIDLTGDGVKELYVEFVSKRLDIRDYDRFQYVLGIKDKEVVEIIQHENGGGGSIGGMNFNIRRNAETGKYELTEYGFIRDGNFYIEEGLIIYEFIDNEFVSVNTAVKSNINKSEFDYNPIYIDTMNNVMDETDLFSDEEQYFRYYKLDGYYISKDEYEAFCNNYQIPTDEEIGLFTTYEYILDSFHESIPSDATLYNGHYYYVYNASSSFSWNEARETCIGMNGHLVTINSYNEQEFLIDLVKSSSKKNMWIGAYLDKDSFKWVTGVEFSFTNWDSDEPNNVFNMQNAAMMYTQNSEHPSGTWNDENENGRDWDGYYLSDFGYICEWDDYNDIISQTMD